MAATKLFGCVLVLASLAGVLSGPINWEDSSLSTCAVECPENSKFAYEQGETYEYKYESDVKTSVTGATEEHSSLHMRATVRMEVLSPCEMNLKLMDVTLQDSDPANYDQRQNVEGAWDFKKALQEKPLRFSYIDGRIDHICPGPEEPAWVLNIKRAVLGAMQNTQRSFDAGHRTRETDIIGDCPVIYSPVGKSWGVKKVKKVKDTLACTQRHGHATAFQGTPYEIDSSIQSLPLMKTSHECEQTVNKDGLLVQSVCTELHLFRPFSEEKSGAQTAVSYKLTYDKKIRGVQSRLEPVSQRSSMLFDHMLSAEEVQDNMNKAQQTLSQLCESSRDDVRPETPKLFGELVREMRTLDTRSLRSLFGSADTMCPQAEKFFIDAVPNLGTAASLALIRDLIGRGTVNEEQAAVWLTHLAFLPQPTLEMLEELRPLLSNSGIIQRKASLAVSTMLHNYCRMHQYCGEAPQVRNIISVFEEQLRYNCVSRTEEEHQATIIALKAIGNTGHAGSASAALARCFQNEEASAELRVAAIQAFRRMPCSADRTELLSVFTNKEMDSEIRINAYLMLMQCANEDLVTRIQALLQDEEINQVGSFVWTHLTNIMESSDPTKEEIRELLGSIDLKAFDLDMRKFSRNMEWSLFSEMLNTGAKIENNIIFSSESFIPRSAMVNLTVDMFGQSINLMEVGGRVEGMDGIIESIFNKEENSVRQKRDAIPNRDLTRFDESFNPKRAGEPHGSAYLKIFGNEIRYEDFHNVQLGELKDSVNYLDWLIKMSQDNEIDYNKSFMFLDSTLTIPTSTGMPLKLAVDGNMVLNVKVNGKMDIRNMFSNPSTIDINGSIKPSAAVEVSSEMSIDAHVARSGLKMTSTMHTSTLTQGKLILEGGKNFHFDLEMPNDKVEVFSAQSKFYILHRNSVREQRMIGQGRTVDKECYDLINPLGVELCGEIAMPVLRKAGVAKFPFTGPASSSLYINKKDTFTKYHIDASLEKGKETEFKLNINTPGSKIDREIDVEFNLNKGARTVMLNTKSPWKKMQATAEVLSTQKVKGLSARAVIDDESEYSFLAQLKTDVKKFGSEYIPSYQLVIPGKPTQSLEGSVFYRDGKKFDIDLTLNNVFSDPLSCKGTVKKMDKKKRVKYDTSLDIVSNAFKGKVDGFVDMINGESQSISSRAVLAYSYRNNKQQKIVLSNKFRNRSSKTLKSFSIDSAITTSFLPKYNTEVSLDYTQGRNTFNAKLEAGFDDVRRIMLSKTLSFINNRKTTSAEVSAKLAAPFKNIDYELTLAHDQTERTIESKALMKYGEGQEATFSLDASRESAKPIKSNVDIKLHYPGREMSLTHSLDEKQPSEYHSDLTVQLDKYSKATAVSVYKMKPRHELTANINLPSLRPIALNAYLSPKFRNVQAHGQVEYGQERYFATTTMKHEGNLKNAFTSEANVDIGIPSRRLEGSAKVSRQNARFNAEGNFKWDAGKTPASQVTLTSQAVVNSKSPSLTARVTWPGHFMQVEGDAQYEQQRSWTATKNDMQASVKLSSSLPKLEDIQASFKHDYGHDEISTTAQVSWAANKKILTDFSFNKNSWKNVDSALTVTTPFRGYRRMKLSGNYLLAEPNLKTELLFQKENQQSKLVVEGMADLSAHKLDGKATLTSPICNVAVTAKHEDNGRNYNSFVELAAEEQKLTGTFNMEHMRTGYAISNNGELILASSKTGVSDSYKVSWNHQNGNDNVNSNLNVNGYIYSLEGDFDDNTRKTSLNGILKIDARPLSSVLPGSHPNYEVRINHNHNRRAISTKFVAEGADSITYEHNIKMAPWQFLEASAKFSSPFKYLRNIQLESKSTKRGLQMTTENEFKWSPNQKINLDGSLNINGPEVNGQIRLTSPFRYAERIVMNVNNGLVQDIWVSHADLDIMNKRYEIDTKLGFGPTKKLFIDTSKLHPYGIVLDTTIEGPARDFTAKGSFEVPDLGYSPYSIDLRVDSANLRDLKSTFLMRTPHSTVPSFKVIVSHKQNGVRCMSDASVEIPSYKASLSNEMVLSSWANFNTKTTAEYGNGQKIELTSQLADRPKIQGSVTFTSPFPKAENINFVVSHEGSLFNFKSNAELSYAPRSKISAGSEFSWAGDRLSLNTRFTSPFAPVQRIIADVKHQGAWNNFNNEASFSIGNKRAATTSTFSLNGNDMSVKASLELPLQKYRTMSVEYNHEGGLDNFKCNGNVEVDGQSGTAILEFANAKVMTGKFELNTPFNAARVFKVNFEHDAKKWNSFENNGRLQLNRQVYSGNSELRWYGTTLRTVANLKTPREEYALKIKHKGTWSDFNNGLTVDLSSGQKYTANSMFKIAGPKIEGSADLSTPHASFDKMSAEFTHTGNLNNFQTSASLNTPFSGYERFSGELTHQGNLNQFRTTGKIDTPFRQLPSAVMTVSHSGNLNAFNSNAELKYNNKAITTAVNFENAGRKIEGSAKLNTPYNHNYQAGFTHQGHRNNFETKYNADINGMKVDSSLSFKNTNKKIQGAIAYNAPYYVYDASFSHEGGYNDFETKAEATYNGQTVSGATTFKNEGSKKEGTVKITAPEYNYEGSFNHQGSLSNFRSNAEATYNGQTVKGSANFKKAGESIEGGASVESPYSYNYEGSFTHNGNMRQFESTATTTINGKTYSGNAKFENGQKVQGSVQLQTPYRKYKNFEASFNHEGTSTNFKTNAEVKTPFDGHDRYALGYTHRGASLRNFQCALELLTSLNGYEKTSLSINHNGDHLAMTSDISLETSMPGYPKFGFNVNHETRGNVNSMVQFTTPIPGYERFAVNVNHNGNARQFETTATLETPIRGYSRFAAKVNHRGTLASFNTQASLDLPFAQYDKFSASVNHRGNLANFNTKASLELPLARYNKFSTSVSHKGSLNDFETKASLDLPFAQYDKYAVAVKHSGSLNSFNTEASLDLPYVGQTAVTVRHNGNLNDFNTVANLQLPIRQYENWGVSVNHNMQRDAITTVAELTMPFRNFNSLKATVNHNGNMGDFVTNAALEYNGKRLEGEASYKKVASYYESTHTGGLKISTPYAYLRNVELSTDHKRGSEQKSGSLQLQHNGQKKLDLDYSYNTGAKKHIQITFSEPRMFELVVNFEGEQSSFTSDVTFDWERTTNVRVELGLKNEKTTSLVDRAITFKTILPSREVGLDFAYTVSAEKYTSKGMIQWDKDAASKLSYETEHSHSSYRRTTYDGKTKISSALVNFETTYSRVVVPGRSCSTDISITMGQTLRVKKDSTYNGDAFTHVFTVQHPEFSRDAVLTVKGNMEELLTEGEINLQFERETINFKGKVADESMGDGMRYVASSQMTYPNLRMDWKFDGQVHNQRDSLGSDMSFDWMTTRDGVKNAQLHSSFDKQSRTGSIEIINPLKHIKISGGEAYHDAYYKVHRFEVEAEMDGKTVKSEFGLDVNGRSIEAKFFSPSNNLLHVYARQVWPSLEFKVYREVSGREIQDVVLNTNLNSDHLIAGRAYLRPQIWSDLKALFSNLDYDTKFLDEMEPLTTTINQELRYKQAAFKRSMQAPMNAYEAVVEDLTRVHARLSRAFNRAYQANEFYLKDSHQAMKRHYDSLARDVIIMKRKMDRVMEPHLRQLRYYSENYQKYVEEMRTAMNARHAEMSRNLDAMAQQMAALKAQHLPKLMRAVETAKTYYSQAKAKVLETYQKVRDHPKVQQLIKTIQKITPGDVFGPLRKLNYRVMTKLQQFRQRYSTIFDAMDDFWDNFARRQEVRDFTLFIEASHERASEAWEKYEVEKTMKVWLKKLSQASWKNLKMRAYNSLMDYLQLERTRFTTYDPRNGNFEFEVYVPVSVDDLQQVPKLNFKQYVDKVKKMIADMTPDEDWSIWDVYYKYKPSLDYNNWMPPFNAHATIAGSHNFMTFDKKFYRFAGECSYLLARDFINGRFSVVINYESVRGDVMKKSINVIADNHQVEIFNDGQIKMDDGAAEMPLVMGQTTVKREFNLITISRPGVDIECDLTHDLCTLKVTGWYFGKTGGLLGTYDNEPATDLMRADNRHASSVEEMAGSWSVGSRCRSANYARSDYTSEHPRFALCAEYFKASTSPFRPCFKQVAPEDFMTMCLHSKEEDVCNSAAAYINECSLNGVNPRMPRHCVKCESPTGETFTEGQNITLPAEAIPKLADVVFVIQQAECNKEVVEKLRDIIDDMRKAFKTNGLTDVRYSIVGFGGEGDLFKAHTRTMGGQLFGREDRVPAALADITYEGHEGDVMAAVRYAAFQPFRTGASKSVILLPCDACREGAVRYTELQQILIERDIRLHMIMNHDFTLKGTKSKSPKTAYMFGIDKDGIYTHKQRGAELEGDAELRKQVAMPKDICAALAEIADGTVFSANQMTGQRASMQKKFVDIIVRLWAKKAAPSTCQMCDCVSDNTGSGMSICHHCEMRNPIYEILPTFEDDDFAEFEEPIEEAVSAVAGEGYSFDFEEPQE